MIYLASIIPEGAGFNDAQLQVFATALATPVGKVYAVLKIFTLALAFVGLLLAAYKVQMGGDLTGLGTQLVTTVLVAIAVSDNNMPRWFLDADVALAEGFNSLLGGGVKDIMNDYVAWAGAMTLEALPGLVAIVLIAGFWGIGIGFIALAVVSCFLIAMTWVLLGVAYAGILVAYYAQVAVLYIGLSLVPLFLGMLLYDKTKETGFKYLMGLVGILFWPLGWNLGFLVLHAIIRYDFASISGGPLFELFFHGTFAAVFHSLNILLAGILGLAVSITIFGMIWAVITKAPGIISAAITTGAQVGTGMMSAVASGGASSFSTAASAGAQVGGAVVSGGSSGGMSMGKGGGGVS